MFITLHMPPVHHSVSLVHHYFKRTTFVILCHFFITVYMPGIHHCMCHFFPLYVSPIHQYVNAICSLMYTYHLFKSVYMPPVHQSPIHHCIHTTWWLYTCHLFSTGICLQPIHQCTCHSFITLYIFRSTARSCTEIYYYIFTVFIRTTSAVT